ncbi:MAG: hypothetical protein IJJ61_03155 [Clostridia bacterium]|nr:hypothetical protein [Clostridia bacterium]
MKKSVKTLISILLVAAMLIGTLAACGKSEKEEKPAITATEVKFSKSGNYVTTVTSDDIDLSGVTADNIEIGYKTPEDEIKTEEDGSTSLTGNKVSVKSKIENVAHNSDGSLDISFAFDAMTDYVPSDYDVVFTELGASASVPVEYPEISVTPDIDSIVAADKETKITLTVEGSEFEDNIGEEDIMLEDAFAEMDVESVSAKGKNITLLLKGKPVRNEAGVYQWGTVSILPDALKDGYSNVSAQIEVEPEYTGFDSSTLKFSDGKITADLAVRGSVDANELTAENIVIDGVSVESVEKKGDDTVTLTLKADEIKSVNDFAGLINGKSIKLGGSEAEISLPQADFYPVFDYVENDGDNLKLTLKLYALGGEFDKKLSADNFSFADDFEGAKVESVKLDSEIVATAVISVPANGQNSDNFNMNGTVKLAAGSLINGWGEATAAECLNSRDYSQESLGREVTLNTETLLEIQKYTEGVNTTFGKICHWGGVAGQVYSIAKSVLEATGIVESEHAEVMRTLNEINGKLDNVLVGISEIKEAISKNLAATLKSRVDDYTKTMNDMNTLLKNINNIYARARNDIKKEYPQYAEIDWDNMTDKEAAEYNSVLNKFILSKSTDVLDNNYYGFASKVDTQLYTLYNHAVNMINSKGDDNPFYLFDEACANTYSFDTEAYEFRLAQRIFAETLLVKVIAAFAVRYDAANDPDNANFSGIIESFNAALKNIDAYSDVGNPASKIDAVPRLEEVEKDTSYISDVKLAGDMKSAEAAKKYLTDEGYTVLDKNFNEGAGGCYIYLGYKVTDNYADAIKNFIFSAGESPFENMTSFSQGNKITYYPIPYTGDATFIAGKGSFNAGVDVESYKKAHPYATVFDTFMYYTKEETGDKKAVVNLFTDDTYQGHENSCPMEMNLYGSEYIRLIYDRAAKPGKIKVQLPKGKDPKYYPFSYILGKKIAIASSNNDSDFYYLHSGKCCTYVDGGSYINLSDEMMNAFRIRCNGVSAKQVMLNAGINISNPIMMKCNMEKKTYYVKQGEYYNYYEVKGDMFDIDTGSIKKDVVFARMRESKDPTGVDNYINKRLQETTNFMLY